MLISKYLAFAVLLVGIQPLEAARNYGMVPVDVSKNADCVQIDNMPRTRTQDSLNFCSPMVATVIIDRQTCVDKKIADCKNMPEELRVSPFDLSRYSGKALNGDRFDREQYVGMPEGGSVSLLLMNSIRTGQIVSEACTPFHQVVAKHSDPAKREEIEKNFWQQLKLLHSKYKEAPKGCKTCDATVLAGIDKLKKDMPVEANEQEILEAFAQENFELMLDRLFVPEKCRFEGLAEINPRYTTEYFPEEKMPNNNESYKKMVAQIKKTITERDAPMAIAFCAEPEKLTSKNVTECTSTSAVGAAEKTGYMHGVVIKGYCRVCKKKGKDCFDAVQVQNSWGQDWQDANNEGWVDAKELLKRTFYDPASLVWLEKEKE